MNTHSHTARSILAVFSGLLLIAVVSHGTDSALQALDIFPAFGNVMSEGMFAAAAVYRTLFGVAGCYVTARLAPQRPQRHALILGWIGTFISAVGAWVTWDSGGALGPHWYALSLVATALPAAWLGAFLHARSQHTTLQRAAA